EAERRHLIAEPCQLVDEAAQQEVRARRCDLADLDEGGAEARARVDERDAERVREPLAPRPGSARRDRFAGEHAPAARARKRELEASRDETATADRRRRCERHERAAV